MEIIDSKIIFLFSYFIRIKRETTLFTLNPRANRGIINDWWINNINGSTSHIILFFLFISLFYFSLPFFFYSYHTFNTMFDHIRWSPLKKFVFSFLIDFDCMRPKRLKAGPAGVEKVPCSIERWKIIRALVHEDRSRLRIANT